MNQKKKSAAKSAAVANGNGNSPDCKSLATFIVDYQAYPGDDGKQQFKTVVTQMDVETDTAVAEEWASLEQRKPCEWIQQRLAEALANQGISQPQTAGAADTPPPVLPPANLKARILAYQMRWPSGTLSVDLPFPEKLVTLAQASTFDLDILFNLEGLPAGHPQGQGYHAACHVIAIGNQRESTCLQGDIQRQLAAGEHGGSAHLAALHLPAGHYETWLSVNPDAAGSRPDLVRGPRVMVS